MSEIIFESGDIPTGFDIVLNALNEFTACVGQAPDNICSYGLTLGDTYVPFDPDPEDECEEDEAICSQVWVRVMAVRPQPGPDAWGGTCAPSFQMDLEVGILRCVETPEKGEAPTATEVLGYAMTALDDMNSIQCAAMNCEVWDAIRIGTWRPNGPMGGQYGGIWTFTVDI